MYVHCDLYFLCFLCLQYINAAESSIYLVDPATNYNEQEESDSAAKKFWYLLSISITT